MSIKNIYFGNRIVQEEKSKNNSMPQQFASNPIEQTQKDVISKEGANALRAYVLHNDINLPPSNIPKGTSSQYIKNLQSKGLVENRDFEVLKDKNKTTIKLKKDGQIFKEILWIDEGNDQIFDSYKFVYKSKCNPNDSIVTCYDSGENFRYRTKTYQTNPIKNDELSFEKTPSEFIDYLKQNNMEYKENFNWENSNISEHKFSYLNPITNTENEVCFTKDLQNNNIFVEKKLFDQNKDLNQSIQYYKDCTKITDYKEKT